jgi:uncharacterized membrane protein YfcA
VNDEILWILAGGVAGGFINGLSGFGLAMAAIPLWLTALSPANAASLAAICAVAAHLQSVSLIAHAIDTRRLMPFIIGGLIGIPVGTWLLAGIDAASFRLWIGTLIVVYSVVMLSGRVRVKVPESKAADGVVGFLGGILGALAGLSGALPAMWSGLRDWGKEARRAVLQPFNMVILALSIVAHAVAGLFTIDLFRAIAFALPATLIGAYAGKGLYRRLGDRHFDRVVLSILLVAGVLVVGSNFLVR